MTCIENQDGQCEQHGCNWPCTTKAVLHDVDRERVRQFQRYGRNADLEDGTGPNVRWALPASANSATQLEQMFREEYEEYEEETGNPTWVHLVREELAEAFQESDSLRLEQELLQVAALAVSWVEKIRERRQWAVQVGENRFVTDSEWHCPADVMKSTHGFEIKGPVTVAYRDPKDPAGKWKAWGSWGDR